MKMNKWIVPVLLLVVVISSCTSSPDFTITKSGLGYKIFSGKGKDSIKPGNFIRFRAVQKIDDSVLTIADETPDQFTRVDSVNRPFDLLEIINKLALGDSVVYRFPVDTIFAQNPNVPAEQFPPYFKKGRNIYVYFKLLEKYNDYNQAESDVRVEMMRIDKYLSEKRNKEFENLGKEKFDGAVKTLNGTLVKILQQGDGPQCDSGKLVNIKYEGRLVNGTVFDGNMKPPVNGNARPPFEFQLGVYPVIPGWVEGLKQLKKGAKAQFFIPWTAGYGAQGSQGAIPPYSNLIFDIEVADVKDAPPASTAPVIPGSPR